MKSLLWSIAFMLLFPACQVSAEPLEILAAYENTPLPPYYFGDTEEIPEQPGIAVDLLKLVDERLPEVRITFRRAPWKRCQKELGEGRVDAIFPASFKPARQEIGVYPTKDSQPDERRNLVTLSYFLYALKEAPIDWDGQQLELKGMVGAPTGYSVVDDLRKRGIEVDDGAPTTKQNLIKLQRKRVLAVAAQDVTVDPILRSTPQFKEIVKLLPPLKTKPNYFMFSHQFMEQHADVAELIWATLETVRDEHLEQLSQNYVETR